MLKDIFSSIRMYFKAFGLISELKLWSYFIIPIIISIVTAVTIGSIAYFFSDNLGSLISNFWIWDWGKSTFSSVSNFLSGLFMIVIGLILFKHIILALSSPFMSPVSEKIARFILKNDDYKSQNTSFLQQLWRGVLINGRNLIMELLLTIPLLILKFIPVVNLFSTALIFLIQAYYAGFGNMDYTLERYFKYKKSIDFIRKHRGLAIGNGIVFMLCLFIPVLGIILVLPLSVTAASVKTIEALSEEEL